MTALASRRHGTRRLVMPSRRSEEALEDLGDSALAALATGFSEHAGVAIDRRLERDLPLSQEALTNITRHARATQVDLRLRLERAARDPRRTMTGPSTARVLVADDHPVVLNGLRRVLEKQPDFCVVAHAADGQEAVAGVLSHDIELAILDISMPRKSGLEAAREILRLKPDVRVLLVSMHDDDEYIFEAIRLGAAGYVLKTAVDRELVDACRAALRGDPFVHPSGGR